LVVVAGKVGKKAEDLEQQMAIKGKEASPHQVGSGSNPCLLDVPLVDPKRNSGKDKKDSFLLSLEG
jgi:hypothetical protein